MVRLIYHRAVVDNYCIQNRRLAILSQTVVSKANERDLKRETEKEIPNNRKSVMQE